MRHWALIFWTAFLLCAGAFAATEAPDEAWWPQFNGPNRDNMSLDKNLLKAWPEGGPKLLWKYGECGGGYSMVSIAKGMIFTVGDFGDSEMLLALSLDGKLLWKAPNGPSWKGAYPGARTTPTYDEGVLYHLNPTGKLAAFEASSGRLQWSLDLRSAFGAQHGTWAFAENLLIDGDKLFCTPGGTKALMAALDKRTGKTLWTNSGLQEVAAYCSPVLVTWQGVRQLLTMTQKSVLSVDPETGKLLWSYPHPTRNDQNIDAPLFHDGYVHVASGHSGGSTLLKINPDGHGVAEVWSNKELDNCHGGVLLLHGCLYGSACRSGGKMFFCADFLTGKVKQSDPKMAKLSLACADGMLYGLSNLGRMLLLSVSPGAFQVVSQFDVPKENNDEYLSHPVICGGRLYVRHGKELYVYSLRGE